MGSELLGSSVVDTITGLYDEEVNSFPGLCPSFCRLQYEKRGVHSEKKSCGVETGNEANE